MKNYYKRTLKLSGFMYYLFDNEDIYYFSSRFDKWCRSCFPRNHILKNLDVKLINFDELPDHIKEKSTRCSSQEVEGVLL